MISVKKRKSDRDVVFAFFEEEDDALVCDVCFEPLFITCGGTKFVCLECGGEE